MELLPATGSFCIRPYSSMEQALHLAEELDLAKCLTSGQVFRWRKVAEYWIGVDGENVFQLPGRGRIHPAEFRRMNSALPGLFRLDWDYPAVLEKLVRAGPELGPLLPAAEGLRLLRPSCPREALFSFLCTSNNHISRITQMVEKLASYGPPLRARNEEGEGLGEAVLRRFPSLERLGEISETDLREKGFGYRAATIPRVAHELLARGGEGYLQDLKAKPYADVYRELIPLPGVGPKLADCIALYAFDKTEAVPIDVHMWRAACPMYFPQWAGTDLTDSKRVALGELLRDRFGTLAAVAQQILFYSSLREGRRRAAV